MDANGGSPPEDDVDPDGAPTTIVADSDDEHEDVPAPAPSPAPAPVKAVEEAATSATASETVEEVKPKKKIIRKKTDA